mgnify:CR=1 FL=1
MAKCNWCGNEVEESMVAHQSVPPVEDICLYCLCKSHPNLKAFLTLEAYAKVEERETSELKSMEVGY